MPRVVWPLVNGRPTVSIVLTLAASGQQIGRNLLADTGAGAAHVGFEVLLAESDCHRCGGIPDPAAARRQFYLFRLFAKGSNISQELDVGFATRGKKGQDL